MLVLRRVVDVNLRRDVAGAGKLERSTGRGHIRAASADRGE